VGDFTWVASNTQLAVLWQCGEAVPAIALTVS
jgi:hypothetical protein